ncbi:Beta-glucosidase 32 [Gossypium australe]|uniref:Beta-glucosidase 32 n=1 Tax=Gossypium australe TaxID=47621 RepID=A0A5B6UJ23_9ROSI|nr:Beta-glucosidase 32 [Gossypium australe]
MALNGGLRSASKFLTSSSQSLLHKSGMEYWAYRKNSTDVLTPFLGNLETVFCNRGFHSTGVKRMGGGHGHDEPYYLHAKHMYNLDRMKNQKLTMSLGVLTAFSIGVFVPIYAVIFQQKKTASG